MKKPNKPQFKEELNPDGTLKWYSRVESVPDLSINLAALYTGKDRRTIAAAARSLASELGPNGPRLYQSAELLQAIYAGPR